ncbi:MAG: hypothetical protein AABW67_04770 [Nanoarchaeota archaeon]
MKNIFNKIKENHWLMMIICCGAPLIIAGILFYFGFKTYAILAVMLLCPILHYFMTNKFLHRSSEFGGAQKCHTNSISDMRDIHKEHGCPEHKENKKKEK